MLFKLSFYYAFVYDTDVVQGQNVIQCNIEGQIRDKQLQRLHLSKWNECKTFDI